MSVLDPFGVPVALQITVLTIDSTVVSDIMKSLYSVIAVISLGHFHDFTCFWTLLTSDTSHLLLFVCFGGIGHIFTVLIVP